MNMDKALTMNRMKKHQVVISMAMRSAPVIPVLVLHDANIAKDLAKTLVEGGLPVLEVTLRTPQAAAAIEEMATVEGAIVAAGTCKTKADLRTAKEAGASMAVSPGITHALLQGAAEIDLPLLPGSDSVSLSMELFDAGFCHQKFFPAEASGGANKLRSISQPLPNITFCPTGGVSPTNAVSYLTLPNVLCVGGSWIAPAELIQENDWDGIKALAKSASELKVGLPS